jgi:tetratricopeptide (TPR) repeat protein
MTIPLNQRSDDDSGSATLQRLGQVLAVVVALTAVTATAGVGAAAQPSADEVLETKKDAERLHSELIAFDEKPETTVDDSSLDTVQYNLERGQLAYANDNYATAADHFETAIEQSKAELSDVYVEAVGVNLDIVDQRLTDVTDLGYETDSTAELSVQLETERDQLKSVSTFAGAQQAYEDSSEIRESATALPTADHVSTAETLNTLGDSLTMLITGVLVMIGVLAGGAWMAYTAVQKRSKNQIQTH